MAKKIKLKIKFSQNRLSPDLKSSENKELLNMLLSDLPLIKKWSDEEQLMGTARKFNHLDHLSLRLCTKSSDNLQSSLSSWSNYNVPVDHFIDATKLNMMFIDGEVNLDGELLIQLGVKEILRSDFLKFTHRLKVVSISFRVKNSGDLITMEQYGSNWELERQLRSAYINDESDDYIKNCPTIELVSR